MTRGFLIGIVAAALGTGAMLHAQTARSADVQMKAARQKAEVEGDLKGAIEAYKKVVASAGSNRVLAAQALMRMADCYRTLGDAESRKIYERVVRDYGDQKEAAAIARAHLGDGVRPPAAVALTTRQIWTGPGADQAESLSPDGRYLSYGDWSTGVGVPAIRDLTTGANRRLLNDSSGSAARSVFSADGLQLAYGWTDCRVPTCAMGEVRVLSLAGGETPTPKTIHRSEETANITPVGWTRDGKQLLVIRILRDRSSQLAMLSAQDGTLRVLKSFGWQGIGGAQLSPDGRYAAYDAPGSDRVPEHDVFVLAIDGSQEAKITDSPAIDWAPVWSADGSRIVFLSDRTGSASAWSVPMESGRAAGAAQLVKPDIGVVTPIAMTRDGALCYVSEVWGRRNVHTAELDAGMKAGAPKLASERYVNVSAAPSWSPDGQYLAYYALLAPTRAMTGITRLVIRTVKTGSEREVRLPRLRIPPYGFVAPPRWFPEGRSVLVASYEQQRPVIGFYRVDVISGAAELLHSTRSQTGPGVGKFALSPDGRSIFYLDLDEPKPRETVPQVMRFDLNEKQAVEVKRGNVFQDVAVSPDGKYLAVATSDYADRSAVLAVMPAGGGDSREVYRLRDTTSLFGLAWSPDGRFLVFPKSEGTGSTLQDVWRVPVAGGDAEKIGGRVNQLYFPSLPGDGRMVAFTSRDYSVPAVWMLEHFLPRRDGERR